MSSGPNRADERFLRVQKDPRFWEMPERKQKIRIDKRFRSMFQDERFRVTSSVDKRGRPVGQTSTEDLRRFYQLSSEEEEEEERGGVQEVGANTAGPVRNQDRQLSTADDDDDEEDLSGEDSGPDLARGKGNVETSSEDEDEVDALLRTEEDQIQHAWGELSRDAPRGDQVSARLAVCNVDWDRLKARDLLVLFGSFVPKGGAVLSVKIYPSEFGKERLKVEESRGPLELKVLPEDSEDDTEEEKVHRERLRDYQFKRLRYFYGVVACDSAATAARIYEECDGYEYESSCSVLDLRFIPDDVTFDEEPRDTAVDVNLAAYTPKLFTSSAAATSKVQLTWDETDHERVTALNRKFNKDELLQMDFKAYLASSSSSSEGEQEQQEEEQEGAGEEPEEELQEEQRRRRRGEEQISRYRELLKGIREKEKKEEDRDMEMEITWVPGLKETTEELVKKKMAGAETLTPWGEYLQRRKEKKKKKKREEEEERGGDEELSDDDLPPDVDLRDPFFSEELGAPGAPGGPEPKKKQKKKKEEAAERAAEEEEEEQRRAEMALLMEEDAGAAERRHFNYDEIVERQNLSKKKKKKLQQKGEEPLDQDYFQVDVGDPRFQAVYTSHLFNLDPSHPSFRRTRATQSLLEEKRRRREEARRLREEELVAPAATPSNPEATPTPPGETGGTESRMDPGLSLLVRSIKSKTERYRAQKKQKVV